LENVESIWFSNRKSLKITNDKMLEFRALRNDKMFSDRGISMNTFDSDEIIIQIYEE